MFELEDSDSYENASLDKYLITHVQKKENLRLILDAVLSNNPNAIRIAKNIMATCEAIGSRPAVPISSVR